MLPRALGLIGIVPLLLSAAADRDKPAVANSASPAAVLTDTTTRVQMQNVDFFVDPKIALHIRQLTGTMRSKVPGPILFDDPTKFVFNVESADVGMTGNDLAALMNRYVFSYRGSPLSNIRITVANGEIVQKGTLHKVASLPFEIHATITATGDGRIKLHPLRTEILGLHVDKLMQGLGLSLEKIISLSKARGATVDGNDIYLAPTTILPPPEIQGRVASVRIEGDQVVMHFGGTTSMSMNIPVRDAKNYMYYRGGTLRFGKLVMLDADMLITDLDPQNTFRFELDRYQPQLVSGYSRTLPSGGLVVFMRDIDRVNRASLAENSGSPVAPLQHTAPAASLH